MKFESWGNLGLVLFLATGLWLCSVASIRAQDVTISIDTSPVGRQQIIDGFGTCLSGTEASQTTWWTNLYYGDLQASMLRMDLSPAFKSPYSDNGYNSPSYGNPGPGRNYVRTYTNAATYTSLFNGRQAKIAVMGPNIDSNIAYFDFTAPGSGPQVAGVAARAGQAFKNYLGDFKLFGSHWSPMPWVKLADGNTYGAGGNNLPANGTPFPFIWLGNFSGGMLDTSGTPRPEFDDSSLGGGGPTSALTQFARCTAAYLRGFQNTYGVPFYAISIQNELDFDEFYNSCFYPLSSGYVAALKAVRAELDQYPDLAGIKIMGPEDVLGGDAYGMWEYGAGSTAADKNLQFLQAVGEDPDATAAEGFFCIHGYDSDGVSAAAATPTQWNWWADGWGASPAPGIPPNVQGFTYYGKKSWMTETSGEDPAWLSPNSGFPGQGAWSLALRIHQALTAGQESAWAYWQLTDGNPVDAYQLTDSATNTNSAKYVAAKHFFRYIRPNSVRVNTTVSGTTNLEASAYLNITNGTMTIVLINVSTNAILATINTPALPAGISMWQSFTSSTNGFWQAGSATVSNAGATVTVPTYGIVTLYGVGVPVLRATSLPGGELNLSWSAAATGYGLQSKTNLESAMAWSVVTDQPVLTNGLFSVSLGPTNRICFYRLSR